MLLLRFLTQYLYISIWNSPFFKIVIDSFDGQRGQSKVQEEKQRRLNIIMKDIKSKKGAQDMKILTARRPKYEDVFNSWL